ncbi:hypothetical protein DB30_03828 [Enhygromyxa salina]|uniref:Proteinase inhibitor I42 chagasin domain-containing protein n=1 Tax=Enhygromyxa salina TaxID=215803 RepID=A0A0C2DHX4_9BACT|nr:hypothetical protein DB30_03828 [Enhygromyxa salina]
MQVEEEPAQASSAITLGDLQTEITAPVGAELYYAYPDHASVGYGAVFEVEDPQIIQHLRTDVAFEQSKADRAGKTGADKATGTFVFKAVAPGTTGLRITRKFRGETEYEAAFTITVVEP